jgi:5'-phosphate synthase pdxT subunit
LDGVPVLVRHASVLACCFHPELTPDRRVHRLFVEMCGVAADSATGAGARAGGLFVQP